MTKIAIIYEKQGNNEEVLRYYTKSLAIMKIIYGDKPHADIAQSLKSIGLIYGKQGKNEEAFRY